MAKAIINYIFVTTGIVLLFHIAGLIPNDNVSLIGYALNPNTAKTDMNSIIFAAFSLGTIGISIAIGLFTGRRELAIYAPVAIFMITLLWDLYKVFEIIRAENTIIAIILFAPIFITMFIVVFDWWRSNG